MALITQDYTLAADFLRKKSLVAIPTETVYGLAGNALDPDVVLKIFEVKNRPTFDPLIVHIPDAASIEAYALQISPLQQLLAEQFWPGPLTILFKKKEIVPDLVTSGLEWVGLRCPSHPLTLSLLKELDFPLAAPSANPFGYISPTEAVHVESQLGEKIPCILDGGPCSVGVESTVVRVEKKEIIILRAGGIQPEELEAITKYSVRIAPHSSSSPASPGLLERHYAPALPLILLPRDEWGKYIQGEKKAAVLYFGVQESDWPTDWLKFGLSEKRDLKEAARNLFRFLRKADESGSEIILAEPVPNIGLGWAINDRLKRASQKYQKQNM